MKYIKSPINYTGNKYRLLKQMLPLFPSNIDTFVDVFGGSGTVLLNVEAKKYIYNDINNFVAEIFKGLLTEDLEVILKEIYKLIDEYELSMTNQEGFEKLRDYYNKIDRNWIVLYTLMCHSFNHQYRFNSKFEYNSSFGKNRSYFSDRQKEDLVQLRKTERDIQVFSDTFLDLDYDKFTECDFLYFDPPYYNSIGIYNDGKRGFKSWGKEEELQLLFLLQELNDMGIRFALSNNLKFENNYLKAFMKDFNVHYFNGDFLNCQHNKTVRMKDIEVLITNY